MLFLLALMSVICAYSISRSFQVPLLFSLARLWLHWSVYPRVLLRTLPSIISSPVLTLHFPRHCSLRQDLSVLPWLDSHLIGDIPSPELTEVCLLLHIKYCDKCMSHHAKGAFLQ